MKVEIKYIFDTETEFRAHIGETPVAVASTHPAAPAGTRPAAPSAPTGTRPAAPAGTRPAAPSAPTGTRPAAPSAPTGTRPAAPSAPTGTRPAAPNSAGAARTRRTDAQLRDAILGCLAEHTSGLDVKSVARICATNPLTIQTRLDAMIESGDLHTDNEVYWLVQAEGNNEPAAEEVENDPDDYAPDLES